MKRVLFVDDEPFILDALRNALRTQRSGWDMEFVTSGQAALDSLALRPGDVVVSDMRMPGMDGVQLLGTVRDRYPGTARVILTGEASNGDLVRALPVAQQVLSKPCNSALIYETVERLLKVQALLSDERIRTCVGGLGPLASFPRCYRALSNAMLREDVSVEEVADLVEQDPALSAKTLSVANSIYFGLARPTASIRNAVRHIGFELLRGLALSIDIYSRIHASVLASKALQGLPERLQQKGRLARQFCSSRALAEEAFTAGLLLDVGYVVLAQCRGQPYIDLLDEAASRQLPVHELERDRLGFTHADVGAYLLGVWGVPPRLVEVVAGHHAPALADLAANPVAVAVHVADVLVDAVWARLPDPLNQVIASIRVQAEVQAHFAEWWAIAASAVPSS
jgi:HD-like signal output (HDOD) protein/ActR/RegA family two-component response regulator